MEETNALNPEQKSLILESLDYLSRVFLGPDEQFAKTLFENGLEEFFKELNELLSGTIQKPIDNIISFSQSFSDAELLLKRLNQQYVKAFVNSPDGITALYQSCYDADGSNLMGSAAVFMMEKYESKGLSQASKLSEPPDHLALELEYLYYILKKGWDTNSRKLLEESREFSETMLQWIQQFHRQLVNKSANTFFSDISKILLETIRILPKII